MTVRPFSTTVQPWSMTVRTTDMTTCSFDLPPKSLQKDRPTYPRIAPSCSSRIVVLEDRSVVLKGLTTTWSCNTSSGRQMLWSHPIIAYTLIWISVTTSRHYTLTSLSLYLPSSSVLLLQRTVLFLSASVIYNVNVFISSTFIGKHYQFSVFSL